MLRKTSILILLIFATMVCRAQTATVSGTVTDADTGEVLVGASIYSSDNRYGQVTDNAGYFELHPLTGESLDVKVSYVSYQTYSFKIKADGNKQIDVKMSRDNKLRDVTVYAPSELGLRSSQMSANALTVRQIKSVPATLGEVDVALKDGDFERYHGSLTAGVMSSAIHAEGPIWKGHTSFSISGRASYLNALVVPTM